jgi:hypothetical protein
VPATRLWQRDVRPEKRTEFVDENCATCAALSVQPAAVIQSMRPDFMYTIAPRCHFPPFPVIPVSVLRRCHFKKIDKHMV